MKIYLCAFLLFCSTNSSAQQNMHITEQLLNGTIRIEAFNKNGKSTGTGFYFTFYADSGKKIPIPVIITNKHVVNGFDQIRLFSFSAVFSQK